MQHREATIRTADGGRYMRQLCRHFAHKLPVREDGDTGTVEFSIGVCSMAVADDALVLRCASPDARSAEELCDVIERHLVRFAWREPLVIEWRPAQAGTDVPAHADGPVGSG